MKSNTLMFNLINIRNKILLFLYKNITKRIFFQMDPEDAHQRALKFGTTITKTSLGKGLLKTLFSYEHPSLEQHILGMHLKNPVGLAAGFDKDAQLLDIMPLIGFGFEEAGSITGEFCEGNPRPRLWRLPQSESLIVYYGLKNKGAEIISNKLKERSFKFPAGISVAKTNSPETVATKAGIDDYCKALQAFHEKNIGDYYTINISCPNSFGGEPFTDPNKLEQLLRTIHKLKVTKPIFLKLAAELDKKTVDTLLTISLDYNISGFICSNLIKDKTNNTLTEQDKKYYQQLNKGGVGGKAAREKSTALVSYVYQQVQKYKKQQKTKREIIVIGCGGVFTAEDAYAKIKAGASLVQLATGLIYRGPSIVSDINYNLVQLLKKDGFSSVKEVVGSQGDNFVT